MTQIYIPTSTLPKTREKESQGEREEGIPPQMVKKD